MSDPSGPRSNFGEKQPAPLSNFAVIICAIVTMVLGPILGLLLTAGLCSIGLSVDSFCGHNAYYTLPLIIPLTCWPVWRTSVGIAKIYNDS